ncbi:MAG: uracil phosphoribosyltransferase [Bacteroidales bacterium]|jgi:uracil phosphoribosyltransferase|nr:uracil phosphoribosyltransferase [Bacteroidales bacterium]
MKVINLGETDSVLGNIVAQMRDKTIQKDSLRFRFNLRRLGQIFGYELSKTLTFTPKEVPTPLATATVRTCDDKVVAATILRAGLPLHEGILEMFDNAESAFIAAYRKYDKGDDFHINIEYCSCPSLEGKTLILSDTLLATGASIEISYRKVLDDGGEPLFTHFVCPIASVYAIEYLQKRMPEKTCLWTAAIDEELTSKSYIVPGLGDAGDLAYGDKL